VKRGLKDENIVVPKDTKTYTGADTRNDYTGWNVSNEVPIMLHNNKNI
jgi:hypothetical protein